MYRNSGTFYFRKKACWRTSYWYFLLFLIIFVLVNCSKEAFFWKAIDFFWKALFECFSISVIDTYSTCQDLLIISLGFGNVGLYVTANGMHDLFEECEFFLINSIFADGLLFQFGCWWIFYCTLCWQIYL